MEMRLDLFQHVAVAVLDLHLNGAFAVLAVQKLGNVQHVVLFELQLVGAVVAQDIAQFCGGHIAVHLAQMIEALPALGRFGAGGDGQRLMELHGHIGSVDHGVLGSARVDRETVDGHGGRSGVEVLVLNGTGIAAVHSVGKVCAEAGDVKQLCALADLLVRRKGYAQPAVGQALLLQGLHGGQDLRNAGLVVGTQQSGAVRGDKSLPLHGGEEGEHGGLHHHAGGRQGHIAAVVVLPDDGLHILAAGIIGGVHVGNEPQCVLVLAARGGGQGAVDVAVLVHMGILHAKSLHLLHQLAGKVELPLGGGVSAGGLVRGGVHPDIIQKPFISAHKAHSFYVSVMYTTTRSFYHTLFSDFLQLFLQHLHGNMRPHAKDEYNSPLKMRQSAQNVLK